MSTLDTQLNWGSSYLVNDVYEPYLVKGQEKAHYIKAARISIFIPYFGCSDCNDSARKYSERL